MQMVTTVNRLTAVKEVMGDFLACREGDRVGLVVFGNSPFLQVPFTTDLTLCRQLLDETDVGMAGPRTALGDAIGLGIRLFDNSDVPTKTIIALTDGNDTASSVPPVEASRIARDRDITIHTIAVGDPTTVGEEEIDQSGTQAGCGDHRRRLLPGTESNGASGNLCEVGYDRNSRGEHGQSSPPTRSVLLAAGRCAGDFIVVQRNAALDPAACTRVRANHEATGQRTHVRSGDRRPMSDLSNFHFIRPVCLVLVPIAVLIWWAFRKQNDPLRNWRGVMEPELFDALTVTHDDGRKWRDLALLVAWVSAAVAVAGPTWRAEPSPFADDPVPVMLLLKSGETMQQSDLTPSRMERARLKIVDFAETRKGQPLGLIAYAGTAHLVLPPTRDTDVVATMAAEVGPDIMPKQGDDLVAALRLANITFDESGGSIVVVADTVAAGNESQLTEFRAANRSSVHILAIARPDTPEETDLKRAASILKADMTMITPDTKDVVTLVRQVADTPVAVSVEGEGTRWAEAGWWLTPIVAALVLAGFRREESRKEQPE